MEIGEHKNDSDVVIEFKDYFNFRKRTTYSNFKRGNIKNPFDKSVFGVGYLGVGPFLSCENERTTDEYVVWNHMIERCYAEQYAEKYSAYFGVCTVCDEWLCFQNFAKWYDRTRYPISERLHIDKDILVSGNKIYSPDTCILVPQRINMIFLNKSNKTGMPNGIQKVGDHTFYASYNGKYVGRFNTIDEAFCARSKVKVEAVRRLAEEYRQVLPQNVYEALMKYEPDIMADKNFNST